VAIVLSIGALLLLAAWWIRSSTKRRRGRRMAAAELAGGASVAGAVIDPLGQIGTDTLKPRRAHAAGRAGSRFGRRRGGADPHDGAPVGSSELAESRPTDGEA
jgi:hypothetical protein